LSVIIKEVTNNKLITIAALAVIIAAGVFFFTKFNKEPGVNPSPVATSDGSPKAAVKDMTHPTLGKYLTDRDGITLYVFADDEISSDSPIVSKCVDDEFSDCSRTWPPYIYEYKGFPEIRDWKVDPLNQKMNLFKRRTNAYQWTYGKQPVYYYIGDEKPGDIKGHGLDDGKWSIIFLGD